MKCVTTCEALQDVIANSLSQRSDLTVEQLIDAVNYYLIILHLWNFKFNRGY